MSYQIQLHYNAYISLFYLLTSNPFHIFFFFPRYRVKGIEVDVKALKDDMVDRLEKEMK